MLYSTLASCFKVLDKINLAIVAWVRDYDRNNYFTRSTTSLLLLLAGRLLPGTTRVVEY